MTPELKKLEKQIPKKHKFGFTLKYQSEFQTELSERASFAVTNQVFKMLEWDVIYVDEHSIEAKRKANSSEMAQYTESIIVSYNSGVVTVKSESLRNGIWDNGRNSRRVNLFIHVFQDTVKNYNRKGLEQLEREEESRENWDDYPVPTELPPPHSVRTPRILFPIGIAILGSVLLAFALAWISLTWVYVILLFEVLVGLALAFS